MPDFRCDMLDESGHTLFPAEIVAQDLEAAIRHATDILHMSNDSSSRYVYSFEVWTRTSRLFPAQRHCLSAGRLAPAMLGLGLAGGALSPPD
jgi:hypothetical protein